MNLFRFPTRINSFGIVFCSKGSIRITADLKHCTLVSHTMFVCPPGRIVQVESQEKASVSLILCEEEFINRIRIDMKQLLHLFMAVREHPCLTLSDEESPKYLTTLLRTTTGRTATEWIDESANISSSIPA